MSATQANIVAFFCAALCVVTVTCMVAVAVSATDVVSATRVALDEAQAELAECQAQVNNSTKR